MKKISKTIVFFGSGPVAAQSLRLLSNDFVLEAVVTKPSTLNQMRAVASDIPIFTVNSKAELDSLIDQKSFKSDLGVLIDFGIIVSSKVIKSFEYGIVNSHFSILPEWRGADPISFAILSGQKQTGVSLMMLVKALDEGPLASYSEQPLNGTETATDLTHSLVNLSHDLLKKELPRILSGSSERGAPQSVTKRAVSYSRKLTKDDGVLDFSKSAKELEAEVRAFIEWPKSHTEIAGKDIVILKASVDESIDGRPGDIFRTEAKTIGIYTKKGALIIEQLKPAGKQAMSSEAFLAGYGDKL